MDFPNRESIEREVKQVIADCLGVELGKIRNKANFDSLGIESLTFTGMELLLQDKYNFGDDDVRALFREATFNKKQFFNYLIVGRFIDYIASKNEKEALAY
ncbi:MAG: phosphopantetheine-binding protein [Nanoarchaeota archaeon]